MLTTAFTYIASLFAIAGTLKFLEEQMQWRIFTYLPAIVLLYFVVMLCSTFGLWERTEDVNNAYRTLKGNLLPAMIFLMLLEADLRKVIQLGPKILFAFFCAALSIGIAFVMSFALFSSELPADAWKTFAALCGSWMGGTGNMAAIQLALDVPDSSMGYTLLIDSIDYALWVMLLLALVPFAARFNRWTGADDTILQSVSQKLHDKTDTSSINPTTSMLLLLALALVTSAIAQTIAEFLPTTVYFTKTAWTVLIVTFAGVVCAMTPLAKLPRANEMSTIILYLIIGLIASRADFNELTQAPLYIVMGLVILALHGLMMTIFAKLFRFDLFTCGIASLANIGGVASAPILAAAYSRALIPVGVLMAMLGYIIGTGGGMLVGRILFGISA